MTENRTTSVEVTFSHSFELKGVGERLSAGTYVVETEEEPLAVASSIGYRRIGTTIRVPTLSGIAHHTIDPHELEKALKSDASKRN